MVPNLLKLKLRGKKTPHTRMHTKHIQNEEVIDITDEKNACSEEYSAVRSKAGANFICKLKGGNCRSWIHLWRVGQRIISEEG